MQSKNFTRKDLTKKIYQDLGFSRSITSSIVDNFIESLISELIRSNHMKITSFGSFQVVQKKERIGRNPKTKVQAKICARKELFCNYIYF